MKVVPFPTKEEDPEATVFTFWIVGETGKANFIFENITADHILYIRKILSEMEDEICEALHDFEE